MKKSFLGILILIGFLSACKKEDSPIISNPVYSGSGMVNFENYYDANNVFGFTAVTLPLQDTFVNLGLRIKITNTQAAFDHDVKVYLSYRDELVYNYAAGDLSRVDPNSPNFLLPVASPYNTQFLSFDFTKPVIIAKGQHDVLLPININTVKMGPASLSALANSFGLSIDSVVGADINVGLQSNLVVKIAAILPPNAYDGTYSVTGYFFHPSKPRALSLTKTLTTVSAKTSLANLGDLGASNYNFDFDTDPSTFTLGNWVSNGATPVAPAAGFMTQDNPAGISTYPDVPNTTFVSSTYNNTYDPAAKTFWMHYGYGVGASNQSGFGRQVYEQWVKQ